MDLEDELSGGGPDEEVTEDRSADALVERAVMDTVRAEEALVGDTARRVPKAWGALAARGVVRFRELSGRAPTDAERRAIWSGLWRAAGAR